MSIFKIASINNLEYRRTHVKRVTGKRAGEHRSQLTSGVMRRRNLDCKNFT